MVKTVQIRITQQTKERLDAIKVHPREPYYSVVDRLLKFYIAYEEKE